MKETYQVILNKAQESLEDANLLLDEGYYDFAASRTYYAMYYTAEALLLARGLSFSSHAAVIANSGKNMRRLVR